MHGAAAALRPRGLGHRRDLRPPAWSLYPTTYVVTAQDHGVNPDDQRAMAAKANDVVELDTSHSPFLSQPRKVADIIAERVRLYSA